MRRLLVMRHAKSDWGTSQADHDRPLNRRGRRSAEAMGELLAAAGEVPHLVLTSTAERARDTAERAVLAGGWQADVEAREALYLASLAGTFEVLAGAPDVERVMLVGHQPTWGELVLRLTGAEVQVRTATVVAIDLPITHWQDAAAARGSIAYVLQPRLFVRD